MLIAAGKVVYDLEAEREKRGDTATALLRLEQYYPLPAADLAAELAQYPGADVVFVQDEPRNQGAWPLRRAPPAAGRVPRPVGLAGHRLDQEAPGGAGRARRSGLRPLTRRPGDPAAPRAPGPFFERVTSVAPVRGATVCRLRVCGVPGRVEGYNRQGARNGSSRSWATRSPR